MQTVLMGTGSSNYIGRAQKILVLQQKVNELQAKQSDSKTKELHNLTGIIIIILIQYIPTYKMLFMGNIIG